MAAVFESVLGAAADELAREVGVVRRERKLTGSLLVQILVWSWWDNPQATWDDMAENAFRWFDLKITPQALQRRAGLPLVELLQQLCQRMLERSMQAQPTTLPILSRFKGVELHDATTLSLTNDLCERFPGCGNQHHCQAAAIKAVVRLEVLSGNVSAAVFGSGREADTKLGPQLPTPQAGSLVMKDRGFFELFFKCYKSDSGWDKSRARRGASRLVELMAKWLARLLEHALLAPTGGPLARTSWRARVRRAAGWVAHFARAMGDRRKLLDVLTKTLEHLKQLRPKAKRTTNPSTLDLLNNPNSLGKCLT